MKKFIYALVFGIFIISSSCQKDIDVVQFNQTNTSSTTSSKTGKSSTFTTAAASKIPSCSDGVNVQNGMLVFTDANHFKTTLECLEQQVEDYNQAFANQYGSLSDNQISDILESSNFNEFQPLIDFENNLPGYKSLRNKVEGQMAKWLNQPDLDMSTYPRNVSVIGQGMRTLVNESSQVKIGNEIVDLTVNPIGLSASLAPSSSCGMIGYSAITKPFDNDTKKLVINCGIAPAFFGSVVGGEGYVYNKKNGHWQRFSTKIFSHIAGNLRTLNCNFVDHTFTHYDDVNNRSWVNPRYRAWFRPALAAKDLDILFAVELSRFTVYQEMNVDVWY